MSSINITNTPSKETLQKYTRSALHIAHILVSFALIIACIIDIIRGDRGPTYFYVAPLAIIHLYLEIHYLATHSPPPTFFKKHLGSLTTLLGKGLLYIFLAGWILAGDYGGCWGSHWGCRGGGPSSIIANVVWVIGVLIALLDLLARAYGFTEWVWDKFDDDGYLHVGRKDDKKSQ